MINLFCFPQAGGGPDFFTKWSARISGVNIVPVSYPLSECGGSKEQENVESFCDNLISSYSNEYLSNSAVFGHSMGAVIGAIFSAKIQQKIALPPKIFIASGCQSPIRFCNSVKSLLSIEVDEALAYISRKGHVRVPRTNSRYVDPILVKRFQDDLKLCETVQLKLLHQLNCPLLYIYGSQDELINPDLDFAGWKIYFSKAVESQQILGGHDYPLTQRRQLFCILDAYLNDVI